MNYLAHIYLSDFDEELIIGNFIADFVKGRKKDDYPHRITKGIELHRAIDHYTDHHLITSESKKRLYPKHHKYSGAVVDLFYDHFLAKNFLSYSTMSLADFADYAYKILTTHSEFLPDRVAGFLPYMIEKNWLVNYSTIEGIGRSLTGLAKRVAFENRMNEAEDDLRLYYSSFEDEFSRFFPQLITFAESMRLK